jgi:hypothetical protein
MELGPDVLLHHKPVPSLDRDVPGHPGPKMELFPDVTGLRQATILGSSWQASGSSTTVLIDESRPRATFC